VSQVTLDRLLGALPERSDLAPLRQALLRASGLDAARAWARSVSYATFDKRVIDEASIADVVAAAAREERARIDALYASLGDVLAFVASGDDDGACRKLIEIGEIAEASDNPASAVEFYLVASQLSERFADRALRTLALRRCGRAYIALGDFDAAHSFYRASSDQAMIANDLESEIIAATGLGNVYTYQGRWKDALEQYDSALKLCDDAFPRLRGQLTLNLAVILREHGDLETSTSYLNQAFELWSDLGISEQSAWYSERGMAMLSRGELDAAESSFRQALESSAGDFGRAMTLDNLAELYIVRGSLNEAESFARAAEEHAVRVGSPRALAEIYTRLGKIFRLRSDLNGVTFFEKALELCRGRAFPLTEANAYYEYGLFRSILGDTEEARSYFERAAQLCAEIGAKQLESAALSHLSL
jgi:tetratricopeptide (TPR) repeat protein